MRARGGGAFLPRRGQPADRPFQMRVLTPRPMGAGTGVRGRRQLVAGMPLAGAGTARARGNGRGGLGVRPASGGGSGGGGNGRGRGTRGGGRGGRGLRGRGRIGRGLSEAAEALLGMGSEHADDEDFMVRPWLSRSSNCFDVALALALAFPHGFSGSKALGFLRARLPETRHALQGPGAGTPGSCGASPPGRLRSSAWLRCGSRTPARGPHLFSAAAGLRRR
jgi:hypothetical protein